MPSITNIKQTEIVILRRILQQQHGSWGTVTGQLARGSSVKALKEVQSTNQWPDLILSSSITRLLVARATAFCTVLLHVRTGNGLQSREIMDNTKLK